MIVKPGLAAGRRGHAGRPRPSRALPSGRGGTPCRWSPDRAARARGRPPACSAISATSASRRRASDPNRFRSAFLRAGPTPGDLVERRGERALLALLAVVASRRTGAPRRGCAAARRAPRRPAGSAAGRGGPGSRPPRAASRGRRAGCAARAPRGPSSPCRAGPRPPSTTTSAGGYENAPALVRAFLLLVEQPGEAPAEHLLHGGEIVLSGHALDLEPPVVRALGQPVLEHHHRPDLVGGPEVRDVVALDPERRLLETELLGELGEGARARAEVRGAPQLVAVERLLGVPRDDLHQLALRAALGHRDADVRPAPRRSATPRGRRGRRARSGTSTRGGTSCRSM